MPRHFSSLNSFRAAVCLTLILLVSAVALAEKTDQLKPQGYVSDFAGVLSPAGKAQITQLCGEVEQKTHAQIAVVTVKTLDGQPIEDFANTLFEKWGIGPKKSGSGVLILLAAQDRSYRIEVGYGLEAILPDGKVGGFFREAVPLLRDNDYDGALLLVTRRVADVIAADRGVTLTGSTPVPARRAPPQDTGWSIGQILLLLFIIFVVYSVMKGSGGSGGNRYTRGGGSGWWIGPVIGSTMGGGRGGWGGGGFGGGGFGGGGGGFGGFGGGSSGGGGASGSW